MSHLRPSGLRAPGFRVVLQAWENSDLQSEECHCLLPKVNNLSIICTWICSLSGRVLWMRWSKVFSTRAGLCSIARWLLAPGLKCPWFMDWSWMSVLSVVLHDLEHQIPLGSVGWSLVGTARDLTRLLWWRGHLCCRQSFVLWFTSSDHKRIVKRS